MFMFLRWGNLVWLIFSAVTVEVTLNFNHANGVLGGRHDGGLQLPSQLLPFLIGMFSFLRTLYYLLREKFSSVNKTSIKEKDEANEVVESTVIVSPSHFSPNPSKLELGGGAALPRADSYHIVARSLPVRYLVGWLPWLGLVVHPDTALKSRLSGIVERGTGLSAVSPRGTGMAPDTHYHAQFQQWAAESPGVATPTHPGQYTPVSNPSQFAPPNSPGQFQQPTTPGQYSAPGPEQYQYSQPNTPGQYPPPSAPEQYQYPLPGAPGQYQHPPSNGPTQ